MSPMMSPLGPAPRRPRALSPELTDSNISTNPDGIDIHDSRAPALAQSTRLDVFRLLVEREPEGLAAGEIARALAVPQNTMSAHLAVLLRAGLVSAQRTGRSIAYRADLPRLQAVMSFLVNDCCEGRPEICAPLIESMTTCCPPKRKGKANARSRV